MKIGIDARMYGQRQTGIGNYIKNLTGCLFQIDQENEYVVFLLEPMFSEFLPPTPRVKKVKVNSHWYGWSEQLFLPWTFYKEKLDLLHFPHFNSPILYRGKTICTIHDITPLFFPGHKMTSALRRWGFRRVFTKTVKYARKILAVSESTKKDIVKYFQIDPTKIVVTYEGAGKQFRVIADQNQIKQLKQKYQITKPFIFYVGVWRNHKNLVGLISAFAILLKKYNLDYQLVLGGKEDPHYPEIRRTWEELGIGDKIIRPGFIAEQELPLFYNAADLFVIPSFYEGFGLIGLEAMACGLPVAASRLASLSEVLGEAAQYFDPHQPAAMVEVIGRVLLDKNLQAQMRQAGFVQVKKYSWQRCAEQTLRVYQRTMDNEQ